MSVIANTTIISNFAGIGQLSVLKQLFNAVYISVEVYEEIQFIIGKAICYSLHANQPKTRLLYHLLACQPPGSHD